MEAGFTRAKNAGNIVMKNLMDFSVGGITYWAFGFALAYGGSSLGGFVAWGGAGVIVAWAFLTSYGVFKLIDVTVGMRVSREEEVAGLDFSEHGSDAYPEFVFRDQVVDLRQPEAEVVEPEAVPARTA